ncbi:hypothetical protein B0H10DRAFT_2065253 [Mycena sp. CBHHK59/15]|nr:hypothetical protein B0H10DRAFT_2065253 [Mycena sp. CBHHK59/15]
MRICSQLYNPDVFLPRLHAPNIFCKCSDHFSGKQNILRTSFEHCRRQAQHMTDRNPKPGNP